MRTSTAVKQFEVSRHWAARTVVVKRHTLRHFVEATGDPLIAELSHDDVARWWATQAGMAPATARVRYSCISCFLSWCRTRGWLDGDPLAGIDKPREPRRSPVTLTSDEIDALFRALPDQRADCICTLMLTLGLRCVELARLEVGDVDLQGGWITVTGKGGHRDVLPLPKVCAESIRALLRRQPAAAGPLIRRHDQPNTALSAQRISEMVAEWMRDAGVKQARLDGRGAHALRRTCATQLLERGNIRQVQAVLRHESLKSTERYLARADAEGLRAVLDA